MLNPTLVSEYTALMTSIVEAQAANRTDVFLSEVHNSSDEVNHLVSLANDVYVDPIVSANASASEVTRVERAMRKAIKTLRAAGA